jgi:hypothetical protein
MASVESTTKSTTGTHLPNNQARPMTTTDKPVDPDRNRGGAPEGNRNNLRWGLRCGQLPADCGHIKRERNKLRRFIEDLVIEAKGEISLLDAALINSAVRWEVHAMLAGRKMQHAADLTTMQEVELSREVAKASDNRDKCLKSMGLEQSANLDNWASIYEQPASPANGLADEKASRKAANAMEGEPALSDAETASKATVNARKAHNRNGGEV